MQSRPKGLSAAVGLFAAVLMATAPTLASAETLVDGPAGKLPLYDGEGAVGFDIYNGAVSR